MYPHLFALACNLCSGVQLSREHCSWKAVGISESKLVTWKTVSCKAARSYRNSFISHRSHYSSNTNNNEVAVLRSVFMCNPPPLPNPFRNICTYTCSQSRVSLGIKPKAITSHPLTSDSDTGGKDCVLSGLGCIFHKCLSAHTLCVSMRVCLCKLPSSTMPKIDSHLLINTPYS